MQDIVGWAFARCACLHVIRHCMCWQCLHDPLIGEKVGGTGSYMSSNIIGCLIALYTRLALLTRRLAQGSCNWPIQWTTCTCMSKLCHVMSH